jgi:hypothetical protein
MPAQGLEAEAVMPGLATEALVVKVTAASPRQWGVTEVMGLSGAEQVDPLWRGMEETRPAKTERQARASRSEATAGKAFPEPEWEATAGMPGQVMVEAADLRGIAWRWALPGILWPLVVQGETVTGEAAAEAMPGAARGAMAATELPGIRASRAEFRWPREATGAMGRPRVLLAVRVAVP